MERTTNLNLPQWEANDPIRRGDFNEAMAKIDSVVTVGSYTGNGAELSAGGLHVELGFRPRFVVISKGLENYANVGTRSMVITEHMTDKAASFAQLSNTGFIVGENANGGTYTLKLNEVGLVYDFIAFQ